MKINYGRGTYGKIELLDDFPTLRNDIEVGNFCSIAENVSAVMAGHNCNWVTTFPFSYKKTFTNAKNIPGHPVAYNLSIGNDVWIGRKSMLVGNIKIGDGCIIGGGSVVRGEFEPYSIIIGNPAYCVRKRFTDDQISKLLKIKWWDWSDEKINENVDLLFSGRIDDFIKKHIKGKI
jgi:acetyltransferase-like isoleucine patch superfamily enzyme